MGFLQHYEEEGRKSLSVCFCLLDQMSSEDEDSLRAMQREMTESCMKIRQSYVFGNQTVNASEFTEFRPGFYTKVEKGIQSYSDSEALFLAEEMIKKEVRKYIQSSDHTNLIVILGERAEEMQTEDYRKIRNWLEQEAETIGFDIL